MALTSSAREVLNRNRLVTDLLRRGCNCYLPVYDDGIDLVVLKHGDAFRVQLKSRWNIDKKYKGRNLLIAFPDGDDWYIAPHEAMEEMANLLGYTTSASWGGEGLAGSYSVPRMGTKLRAAMASFTLDAMIGPIAEV